MPTVLGQEVRLPVEVRDASSGTVIFEVDADAARAQVPAAFEVVEVAPGRAQFALVVVDYRDIDLGSYREVGLLFFVRPAGGGPDGTYIARLPVDQPFTCAAGREIWGFPKTLERIDLHLSETSTTCALFMNNELVLRLSLPRAGGDAMEQMEMTSYTLLDGVAHATAFRQGGTGSGLVLGDEGVSLELGTHPVSQELAALGLPCPAVLSTWTERMQATFEAPRPLA